MKPIVDTITQEWITKYKPCADAVKKYHYLIGKPPLVIIRRLVQNKDYKYANWLIVRVMSYHDYVSYAVFSAEQVIDIYEKQYPDDKRPRQAIEAARRCIENPSDKNKSAAKKAARSIAWSAAESIAESIARSAEKAAWSAAWSAARSAAECAECAAESATRSAGKAVEARLWEKFLSYGLTLLKV